jgi:hypothetical protein
MVKDAQDMPSPKGSSLKGETLKFNPQDFFRELEYLGEFESVRQIYYIYRKNHDFILVTLSKSRLDSLNVSFISGKCIEYVVNRFKRKIIDRKDLERQNTHIFGNCREKSFKILNTFYVLCVLGMAEKANEVEHSTMKFRIGGKG